jgi:zinc transport system permease protein
MQIVGVLLISALLIIPPATARQFATSPEQMAGISIVVGSLSVLLGMVLSVKADTPAGPSIVAMATVLFLLSQLCHSRR